MLNSIQFSPHIRSKDTVTTIMAATIMAMTAVYAMAVYFYGFRAVYLCVISVITAILADWLCVLLRGKVPSLRDLSPVVTGMLIPLMMPASVSATVVVIAVLFGIIICKHPFGGVGENIFNPAAAGIAFAVISFPEQMFSFPVPFEELPIEWNVSGVQLVASPSVTINLGGIPSAEPIHMLLGNVPSEMGASCIPILISCLLFLWVWRALDIRPFLAYVVGVTLIAALFPRIPVSPFVSAGYELISGSILFAGIFFLADPVTTPKRPAPRIVFGFVTGAMAMIFRHLGSFEESVVFAILLMNSSVWIMDSVAERLAHKARVKRYNLKEDSR